MTDFDNPSALFRFEDRLKGWIGERLFYAPYFARQGGFRGQERVLDFGCGGGVSTRHIARRLAGGGEVVGVEPSSYFAARAEKRLSGFGNARVLGQRIMELDLQPQSFDLVSIIHVIHDIPKVEREHTVRALASVLKPGGRLWIWEPTRESHGMPAGEIRALMNGAGLQEVDALIKGQSFQGVFEKIICRC